MGRVWWTCVAWCAIICNVASTPCTYDLRREPRSEMSAWGAPTASAWANADAGEDDLPAPLPTLGGNDAAEDEDAFPSLDAAAKAPSRKKKTTKKMSLTDFQAGKFQPKPKRELTQAEIRALLPTAPLPKDQVDTQDVAPIASGAYNRYGSERGGFERSRDDGRRGYGFGEGRPTEEGRRGFGFGAGDRQERGGSGGFGARDEGGREPLDEGPSRADEVDDWTKGKKFAPTTGDAARGRGGFGEREEKRGFGFRDEYSGPPAEERRGFGFHDRPVEDLGPSPADEVDNWNKAKKFQPTAPVDAHAGRAAHANTQDTWARTAPAPTGERPKLQLKPRSKETGEVPPTADVPSRNSIFGDAKPVVVKYEEEEPAEARSKSPLSREAERSQGFASYKERHPASREREEAHAPPPPSGERRKLNLQPRSAEGKAPAAATNSSIFGGARPREETLAEKGRDWRKEDLALEHKVDRKPSKEEKSLSAQIELLKKQVADGQGEAFVPGEEGATVSSKLSSLELELARLTLELDDKVRFSKGHSKSHEDGKDHAKQEVAGSNGSATPEPEPAH